MDFMSLKAYAEKRAAQKKEQYGGDSKAKGAPGKFDALKKQGIGKGSGAAADAIQALNDNEQ